MSHLLYGPVKAGRALRRGETAFVDAQPTKGELSISEGEDGLVHFLWTNRETREVDLDLIIFPSDATFVRVSQSTPSMHVLKFSSSDQRYFFYFQDKFTGSYASYASNISGLLDDPEFIVNTGADVAGRSAPAASAPSEPVASSSSAPAGLTPDRLAELQALVAGLPQDLASPAASGIPEFALSDILSPSALAPLFSTADPAVLRTIFPTLPSDLPIPPSEDVLRRVVESPTFQAQVRALDRALQTGLVGNLVVGLGLPEEAGLGLRPFLEAIQEQARKKKAESGGDELMETD